MPKLTPDLLKRALSEKGHRLELRDETEAGLAIRITDTGKKTWSLRYRTPSGEHRRKSLGSYPSVTLSMAREEARKLKGALAGGLDVVAEERSVRVELALRRQRTVCAVAEAYFSDAAIGLHRAGAGSPKRASTLKEERRVFDRLVAPSLGAVSVSEIRRADIQTLVSSLSRKAPSNGRHARNILRQLLAYAMWKELIEHNPASSIAVLASKPRDRVLTDEELALLWEAWERGASCAPVSPEMGLALQLVAVTLQRGGEIVGARANEFDLSRRIWMVPAARMKGKRPHLVPLSDRAAAIVEKALALGGGSPWLFPSPRDATRPLDRHSLSRAMKRTSSMLRLEDITAHDLRRTGATNLTSERVGMPRFIVSQVLGHSSDGGGAAVVTGRHYDLNDYLSEKRRALQAWADLLANITSGQVQPNNVIRMRG